MNFETFSRYASDLGAPVDPSAYRRFERYAEELHDWSSRVRLISRGDRDHVWSRHFLDSLSALPQVPRGARILDLGSGAGFPGLPLRLVRDDLKLTLLDATRMKVLFLKHLVRELALENVEVLHGRAEDLGRESASFQVVTARAVASLENLVDLARPFLVPGGLLLAYKGAEEEPDCEVDRTIVVNPESGRKRAIWSVRM